MTRYIATRNTNTSTSTAIFAIQSNLRYSIESPHRSSTSDIPGHVFGNENGPAASGNLAWSAFSESRTARAFSKLNALGDACFSRFLGHGSVEETDEVCGASFAKCAFCPAEGHRFCVFGDEGPGTTRKRDEACLVCAAASRNPGSLVRAPPSPVERRRFPRRVSSRVRDALESDDDDAWRFE